MSAKSSLHGLTCPNCGGVLSIPEGQRIVRCPYCEMRSLVRGERGLRRYQVKQNVKPEGAVEALQRFFKSNWAIARDVSRRAQMAESFLVYLPFWSVWGRVAGWAFGEKKVGSDHPRYEPREVRIVQDMSWNGAACDVGEFGVTHAPIGAQEDLEPYDPDALHRAGMVFEPAGSFGEARETAENQFQEDVRRKARLDRLSQLFIRSFRRHFGLVYYPLWVMRYLYRGRVFQVVVDGYSGKVLYGKAPGNTLYRAGVLVAGMAAGAFVAVDAAAFFISSGNSHSDNSIGAGIFAFIIGLGIMLAAYRAFRYGEQYEYRRKSPFGDGTGNPFTILSTDLSSMDLGPVKFGDVEKWIDRLN